MNISGNKKFKCIAYWLLVLVLAFNVSLTGFALDKPEDTKTKTSEITSIVEQDEDKTIDEVKKEFKERNKETIVNPLSIFANLLTLILIMFAIAWLYKKYGQNFVTKAIANKISNPNSINLLSTLPIGQNKFLHIIEVDKERVLIGSTNNHISLIKSLKNTEEKAVSNE